MLADNLKKHRIILASRSPRRQQLLRQLGIRFDVVIKEFNEMYPEILKGEEIPIFVAGEKAHTFKDEIEESDIVITADTIVWSGNEVLNKPADFNEAYDMLRSLSGKIHEVITGVCIYSISSEKVFASSTKVTFDVLTDRELDFYIKKFKPFDKAGAYGIQEWIGLAGITRIEGSYFNVMGLPVQQLYKELKKFIL